MDACSGVDGTWGMQARFHDVSMKVAAPMLARIRDAEPDHIATDCPLSALRIQEGLGRAAVHPVVLLAPRLRAGGRMRPLVREEIAPLGSYAALRDAYRSAVIEHKRARRMAVGPQVTLVFEDRETLRFQVQEMLWVERIQEPERVQQELDVYNELMPGPLELSATLLIEITEPGRIRAELDRLVGLDEHVALVLGSGDGARRVPARFDAKQFEADRIAAVQYIRFALDDAGLALLADLREPAAIRIDHPNYSQTAPLPPEVRASLVAGLRADPESLLPSVPAPR